MSIYLAFWNLVWPFLLGNADFRVFENHSFYFILVCIYTIKNFHFEDKLIFFPEKMGVGGKASELASLKHWVLTNKKIKLIVSGLISEDEQLLEPKFVRFDYSYLW